MTKHKKPGPERVDPEALAAHARDLKAQGKVSAAVAMLRHLVGADACPRRHEAAELACAVHELFAQLRPPGHRETGNDHLYRSICMRVWWGVSSTTDLTDEHANGRYGCRWLEKLLCNPRARDAAILAAIDAWDGGKR
ncbi:MAG TPA: hypothetical protein ENK18_13430 [Deltaproteobacteria bacterium]|nr:hypothetical protein [Deltaproteobacteria bacterium]